MHVLRVILPCMFDEFNVFGHYMKKQEIFFSKRKFSSCIHVEKFSIFATRFCMTLSMIPPDKLHPARIIRICLFIYTVLNIPMVISMGHYPMALALGRHSYGKEYPIG